MLICLVSGFRVNKNHTSEKAKKTIRNFVNSRIENPLIKINKELLLNNPEITPDIIKTNFEQNICFKIIDINSGIYILKQ